METTQSCHRTKYLAYLSAKILKSSVTKMSTEVPFNSKKNNLLEEKLGFHHLPRKYSQYLQETDGQFNKSDISVEGCSPPSQDHAPRNAQKWFLPKHLQVLPKLSEVSTQVPARPQFGGKLRSLSVDVDLAGVQMTSFLAVPGRHPQRCAQSIISLLKTHHA